jgi:quinone-modifying oxidoreductase, subunit QmoA
MIPDAKPILVIGGGIAGLTAALEAAEVGYEVIVVEKEAYLGGRVARMHQYFPKMCPPACGLEINMRRIRQNPRVRVHTLTTVEDVSGSAGQFTVRLKIRPRYVTDVGGLDDAVAKDLSSERPNEFNFGLNTTKALYRPFGNAFPDQYVLDREALSDEDAKKLLEACPEGAIDLDMKEEELEVEVGSIVLATGWRPYDAKKLENLGFGKFPNVITNAMMERFASKEGPTGGEIMRPSDGKPAERVAFVQCAGSRDENHLPYCSAVCCMGSLKQARYIRSQSDSSKITIFYIDIRTLGRHEKFYFDMLEDGNLTFTKGKVAKISEDPESNDLILDVEDTLSGTKLHDKFDLVVLATGVVPNTDEVKSLAGWTFDDYGFVDGAGLADGVYAAGCVKRPCDVSRTTKDATGAALKAIQSLVMSPAQ